MAINYALIDETFDRIERPDTEWNQHEYARESNVCGTSHCFAGHGLCVSGYTFMPNEAVGIVAWILVDPDGTPLEQGELIVAPDGEQVLTSPAFVRACNLFGFDYQTGIDVFGCVWVKDVDVMRTRVKQAVENQLAREAGAPTPHGFLAGDTYLLRSLPGGSERSTACSTGSRSPTR